jgi:hypothetical protein
MVDDLVDTRVRNRYGCAGAGSTALPWRGRADREHTNVRTFGCSLHDRPGVDATDRFQGASRPAVAKRTPERAGDLASLRCGISKWSRCTSVGLRRAIPRSGCTNREVAETLVLSENTVARHLTNILIETGLENRAGGRLARSY